MADIEPKPDVLPVADVAATQASHIGAAARLRNYFLTGLVVAGPLAVTIWIVW